MLPDSVLVLGSSGQVGKAFCNLLGKKAIGLSSQDADFTKPDILASALQHYSAKIIINAAACTSVDALEEQESSAHLVNADAPKVLAAIAKHDDIPLIHFSTDYVFDGSGEKPWQEDDPTGPLNAYGRTKLAGEESIKEVSGKYLIFRTSWIFSEGDKNFVNTMLKLGKEREVISVVDDQVGSPSFAGDLAQAIIEAISLALNKDVFPSGVYHICNKGETNWFEFAEEIFRQANEAGINLEVKEVKPIKTKDYPTAATRPLNSRLDTSKLRDTFGIELPDWQDGLKRCIATVNSISIN